MLVSTLLLGFVGVANAGTLDCVTAAGNCELYPECDLTTAQVKESVSKINSFDAGTFKPNACSAGYDVASAELVTSKCKKNGTSGDDAEKVALKIDNDWATKTCVVYPACDVPTSAVKQAVSKIASYDAGTFKPNACSAGFELVSAELVTSKCKKNGTSGDEAENVALKKDNDWATNTCKEITTACDVPTSAVKESASKIKGYDAVTFKPNACSDGYNLASAELVTSKCKKNGTSGDEAENVALKSDNDWATKTCVAYPACDVPTSAVKESASKIKSYDAATFKPNACSAGYNLASAELVTSKCTKNGTSGDEAENVALKSDNDWATKTCVVYPNCDLTTDDVKEAVSKIKSFDAGTFKPNACSENFELASDAKISSKCTKSGTSGAGDEKVALKVTNDWAAETCKAWPTCNISKADIDTVVTAFDATTYAPKTCAGGKAVTHTDELSNKCTKSGTSGEAAELIAVITCPDCNKKSSDLTAAQIGTFSKGKPVTCAAKYALADDTKISNICSKAGSGAEQTNAYAASAFDATCKLQDCNVAIADHKKVVATFTANKPATCKATTKYVADDSLITTECTKVGSAGDDNDKTGFAVAGNNWDTLTCLDLPACNVKTEDRSAVVAEFTGIKPSKCKADGHVIADDSLINNRCTKSGTADAAAELTAYAANEDWKKKSCAAPCTAPSDMKNTEVDTTAEANKFTPVGFSVALKCKSLYAGTPASEACTGSPGAYSIKTGCTPIACEKPDVPTGFKYSAPTSGDSLKAFEFKAQGWTCDTTTHTGEAKATACTTAGKYTVSGCVATDAKCAQAPANAAYNYDAENDVVLEAGKFEVKNLKCAENFVGDPEAKMCAAAGQPFTLSGCTAVPVKKTISSSVSFQGTFSFDDGPVSDSAFLDALKKGIQKSVDDSAENPKSVVTLGVVSFTKDRRNLSARTSLRQLADTPVAGKLEVLYTIAYIGAPDGLAALQAKIKAGAGADTFQDDLVENVTAEVSAAQITGVTVTKATANAFTTADTPEPPAAKTTSSGYGVVPGIISSVLLVLAAYF